MFSRKLSFEPEIQLAHIWVQKMCELFYVWVLEQLLSLRAWVLEQILSISIHIMGFEELKGDRKKEIQFSWRNENKTALNPILNLFQ